MIGGWVVKLLAGIAAAAFAIIGLGAPLVVRAQLDGTAQDAAGAAADAVFRGEDANGAIAAAQQVATRADAAAEKVTIDADRRTVHVKLSKDLHPALFGRINQLHSWYHVTARATAVAQQ